MGISDSTAGNTSTADYAAAALAAILEEVGPVRVRVDTFHKYLADRYQQNRLTARRDSLSDEIELYLD